MFTFTAKHSDWTVGGNASGFSLKERDGKKRLAVSLPTGEDVYYVTGNWTFWTSGTVAFQIDLDADNAA